MAAKKRRRKVKPLAPDAMRPIPPHEWTARDNERMQALAGIEREACRVIALRGDQRNNFLFTVLRACQLDPILAAELLRMIKDVEVYRKRRAKDDSPFQASITGMVKAARRKPGGSSRG